MAGSPAVEVRHARLRGSRGVTASGRARVRSVLRHADLLPPGLPSNAVLIVRHTTVALPASVAAPGGVGTRAWEAGARSRLADAMGRAARPADGAVPADADAVLFTDRAELVACLTRDATLGRSAARWWWHAWSMPLRSGGVPGLLEREVRLLPSVLATLHGWGAAADVVGTLSGREARRVLGTLARAFELPAPHGAPAGSCAACRPSGASVTADAGSRVTHGGAHHPVWAGVLGDAVPGWLPAEPAALLAVGLVLARSQRAARSTLLRCVLEHPEGASGAITAPPTTTPGAPDRDVEDDSSAPASSAAEPSANGRHRHSAARSSVDLPAGHPLPAGTDATGGARGDIDTERRKPDVDAAAPSVVAGRPTTALTDAPSTRSRLDGASAPADHSGRRRPGAGDTVDVPDAHGAVQPASADGLATELAGVLYLVNLIDALGLPDVVAPAWHLDELTGWGLVELLARGLLDDVSGIADDPLWRLLAELDGRDPAEPVGIDLAVVPRFVLPDAWRDDPAASVVAGEVRAVPAAAPGPLTRHVTAACGAWLAGALPFLRRRLADALGEVDPVTVLRVPGRLHVTRTHLDAVMPLASVSVAARLAGLDRDPGWVPRLGRVVAFRFVEEPRP